MEDEQSEGDADDDGDASKDESRRRRRSASRHHMYIGPRVTQEGLRPLNQTRSATLCSGASTFDVDLTQGS